MLLENISSMQDWADYPSTDKSIHLNLPCKPRKAGLKMSLLMLLTDLLQIEMLLLMDPELP